MLNQGDWRGVWKRSGPKQWVRQWPQAYEMAAVSASLWSCRYLCLHDQQGSNDQPFNLICQKDRLLLALLGVGPAAQSNLWKSQFSPEVREKVLTVKQDIPVFMSMITKWIYSHPCSPMSDELLSQSLKLLPPFSYGVFFVCFLHFGPEMHIDTSETTKENSTVAKYFAYIILLWITSSF